MKCLLIHTNHLGQVCTEHGDICRGNSTAQTEFTFESLEAARQHAQGFIQRFPELECDLTIVDRSHRESVRNQSSQNEFIRQHCTPPKRDRIRDIALTSLMIASLTGNLVTVIFLLVRS